MTRPSEAEVAELMSVGQCEACGGPTMSLARHICEPCKARALSTAPLPSGEPRDLSGYCVACGQEAGPHNTYGDAEGRHALNVYPNFSVCDSCLPSSDDTAPLTNEMEPEEAALRCWHNDFTGRCIPFEEIAEQLMRWTALRGTPPAAAQDTARLDWLENEMNREQELLAQGVVFGPMLSLFRRNTPITRAAIDNAMDAARAAGGE